LNSRPSSPANAGNPRPVKVLVMLLLPVIAFIIVSCGDSTSAPRAAYAGTIEGKPPGLGAPVPDPKEVVETRPADALPQFVDSMTGPAHDRLMVQYKGAVDHYDAYSHIPCYCGCAAYTTAHTSLAQCFVKEKPADGQVVFTDHSTSCDLCQQAAQMTLDGIAQSKPLQDVRADIFQKLKYTGIWTDTPPVP
jgi:hypothetical protein